MGEDQEWKKKQQVLRRVQSELTPWQIRRDTRDRAWNTFQPIEEIAGAKLKEAVETARADFLEEIRPLIKSAWEKYIEAIEIAHHDYGMMTNPAYEAYTKAKLAADRAYEEAKIEQRQRKKKGKPE